jgi:hypothetical protein
MVSGFYVAPSFTQYLANAVGKYQGAKKEKEALGQFGEYQKGKQAQLANLLNESDPVKFQQSLNQIQQEFIQNMKTILQAIL